jgi:hypothetical protein
MSEGDVSESVWQQFDWHVLSTSDLTTLCIAQVGRGGPTLSKKSPFFDSIGHKLL